MVQLAMSASACRSLRGGVSPAREVVNLAQSRCRLGGTIADALELQCAVSKSACRAPSRSGGVPKLDEKGEAHLIALLQPRA